MSCSHPHRCRCRGGFGHKLIMREWTKAELKELDKAIEKRRVVLIRKWQDGTMNSKEWDEFQELPPIDRLLL